MLGGPNSGYELTVLRLPFRCHKVEALALFPLVFCAPPFPSPHLAKEIPILPSSLSMVQHAIEMIDHPLSGFFEPPEALAKKLYDLANLETDPKLPYGIVLALQSQTFYRMMIDYYFIYRVEPILRGASSAPTLKRGKIPSYRSTHISALSAFDVAAAHTVYDNLITEFWRTYAAYFTEMHLNRIASSPKGSDDGQFAIGVELKHFPPDKRRAFARMEPTMLRTMFDKHAGHVVSNVFRPFFLGEMLKAADENTDLQRRVQSIRTSTSSSSSDDKPCTSCERA